MSNRETLFHALAQRDASARTALIDGCQTRMRLLVEMLVPDFSAREVSHVLDSVAGRLDQHLSTSAPEEIAGTFDRTVVRFVREATFDELWEKLRHEIERRALIVMKRLPYAQRDVDELLQEGWVRGRRGFNDFVWQGEKLFVSWISAIMGHRVQELRRVRNAAIGQGGNRPEGEDAQRPEPESSVATPSRQLRAMERFQKFRNAIEQLPEIDRDLIHLRYFEKRSVSDTAAQLSMSEAAVKTRAKRARQKLRQALGDSFTPSLSLGSEEGPAGMNPGIERTEQK